jgi:hypothetical protein
MGKNKGISFENYLQLVVAELAIAGYSKEDDYPDEDEVKEDWLGDKTPKECADSFIEGWTKAGIVPNIINGGEEDESH